jgi:hypothetical protein
VVDPNQWTYKAVNRDVSNFIKGNAVTTLTGYNSSTGKAVAVSSTWNGCIEERDTVPDSLFSPVNPGAKDLDINLVPSSRETRWRPAWPQIQYIRDTPAIDYLPLSNSNLGQPSNVCPKSAQKLAVMTRSSVETYVNGLTASGYTYHDLGMIWGARLISPVGLFASENTTAPSGDPISRHIVFMTDGMLNTQPNISTPYGIEQIDRRVTSGVSTPTQSDRHNGRFEAVCQAARNLNVTVWLVGFGTALTDPMYRCAGDDPASPSTASHTFAASDTATLKLQFKKIASNIAALRLGK